MPAPAQFSTLRIQIGGVPVIELARQFGTPAYVYDAAKIVERINDLRAFDSIRFAQKACSNLAILDLARRNGVLVDAVRSGGHWRPDIPRTAIRPPSCIRPISLIASRSNWS